MNETIEQARVRIEPTRGQLLKSDLSMDLKYKGLVQVAYEYVVAGFPEEAVAVLAAVSPVYFLESAPRQMRQDVEFFVRASAVYRAFRDIGVLPFTFEIVPRATA